MRKLWARINEFWDEQVGAVALSLAVVECRWRGEHGAPAQVWTGADKRQIKTVCSVCGAEL